MDLVINSVTTPLALAALVVLTFSGIYQAKNVKGGKVITKQAFGIILVFGLFGNLSYLAKEFFSLT